MVCHLVPNMAPAPTSLVQYQGISGLPCAGRCAKTLFKLTELILRWCWCWCWWWWWWRRRRGWRGWQLVPVMIMEKRTAISIINIMCNYRPHSFHSSWSLKMVLTDWAMADFLSFPLASMLLDEMLTLANPRKSSKTCWETPASKHISQGHFFISTRVATWVSFDIAGGLGLSAFFHQKRASATSVRVWNTKYAILGTPASNELGLY